MKRLSWLLVAAVMAGALLRLPALGLRPMHTDEAVHAIKFGALLETGTYRYDKDEYHGPTLNYLTLIPAWVLSERTLSEVNEVTLRSVPVAFGLGLLLLPLLLRNVGPIPVVSIVALTAVSPAMSFYSRYYIQEMLLVFFTFGLIVTMYRLSLTGRMRWALASGACAGLMSATKETWIIPFGAIVISGSTVLLFRRRQQWGTLPVTFLHLIAAGITGIMVSVVLFSSFFTHWQGVTDAVLAYRTYFDRAGTIGPHIHPWYYYLELLTFWKVDQGPWWSEAPILICGIAGLLGVIFKKHAIENSHICFTTFSASFALVMITVYSVIPYKTPWLVVGALQGLIILAGFGIASILQWCTRLWLRRTVTLVLLACVVHLGWQAYRANITYYESPANPYVYAHTSNDVKVVAKTVKEMVQHAPSGVSTPVQVVVPEGQYWPLPWYLRSLPNVGWWSSLDSTFVSTAVILASREVEGSVLEQLYEKPLPGGRNLYVPLFERPLRLRPGVEVVGYVTLDLWNSVHKEK